MLNDPVLCYVDAPWAYFTTQPLADQWGDDWDDAPYEHNAGRPYEPRCFYHADGVVKKDEKDWLPDGSPRYTIIRVAFEADLETPCYGYLNSGWSVQQINAGAIAWLRTRPYAKQQVCIPAGTTLARFRELIRQVGGTVYERTAIAN